MLDTSIAGGMVGNLAFMLIGIVILGAVGVGGWFVWTKFLNFPLETYLYIRRGDYVMPKHTASRFEKSKEGKDVLVIKGLPGHYQSVSYEDILPGNKLILYSPNQGEVRSASNKITVGIDGKELLEFKPQMDETMRFAFASALEHIWMQTNPNDLMNKYGAIIWLITAGVLLMLVLMPVMDAANKEATALVQAAASLTEANAKVVSACNLDADNEATGTAPPVDIYAPPV